MTKQLLLLSSSYTAGYEGYLAAYSKRIETFLGQPKHNKHILFIPYAGHQDVWEEDTATAKSLFSHLGYNLVSIHQRGSEVDVINDGNVQAIFIGGGNTFRLLHNLQTKHLVRPIVSRCLSGLPYIGVSAGSVVACPTIKTTNDMPIVEVNSTQALGLFLWQINPHFFFGSVIKGHKGETREVRIREYFQENNAPVVGLPEGSCLWVSGRKVTLYGDSDEARLFRRHLVAEWWESGTTKTME